MIAVAPSHKNQLSNYLTWLEKRGFPYRVLSESDSLHGFSMLLLCGGPDVGKNKKRDDLEISWFKEAFMRIPILGICRGMQLANVVMGGTLYEDLNEENVKHTTSLAIANEPSSMKSSWHEIETNEGNIFKVNSRHHQGVMNVASCFSPTGFCKEDRLIEMMIGEKSLFVQWHPEREEVWGTECERIVSDWVKSHLEEIPLYEKAKAYAESKGFSVLSIDRVKSLAKCKEEEVYEMAKSNKLKIVTDKRGKKAIKLL